MAGNKISDTLFKNKQRHITQKIKYIAFIASVLVISLHGNALATTAQCLSIKSKLCKSYREFAKIKKDPSFLDVGFRRGGSHYQWLEKLQSDAKNPKYDRYMLYECKSKELGCDGSDCMTFGQLETLATNSTSRSFHSESSELIDKNFKKFCK